MKRTSTCLLLLSLLFLAIGQMQAQNHVTYGFVQDPVDQLKLTAVAYPNFTSNNVTISTALFTFYLPEGTVTTPAIPVLPATGVFTDVTGSWRIEKITPDLYESFGFNPLDLQGNDIYQCILQNSPSPNTTAGQPISLFSFRLPADCIGGTVQVHINDNVIQQALINNVGININNQMSISVNDLPSVDLYNGNNPLTDNYDCPLDDVPVAVDDNATTNEDVAVTVNVTGNDSFGTDGPSMGTITIVTPPVNGIAVVDNNGTPNNPADDKILYTPNANYNGTDVIVYQICDADNDCDQATVNITINAVNDPPVVPNTTVSTPEDTPVPICVPIADVDNGSFTVTALCQPDNGAISGLTNPATNQYCLTYTPNTNFNGSDTLCILICDGAGGCDTSYVYIDVTPVNDPPVAVDDSATTPEDTPITFSLTANDTDVDGTIDLASLDLDPNNGGIQTTLTVAGGTFVYDGAGNVTFTPDPNFNGTVTAQYRVCDTGTPLPAQCDLATITVTVTPVNDAPVVPNTTVSTPEDTPIPICVPIADVDNASFTVTTLCSPSHGTISGLTNPATNQYCLTYTPASNYNGPDTLCILICDGAGGCDTSYVYITVTPVNDPPVVPNTTVSTQEDTPISICVPITDVDNTSFTVTALCPPGHGTISGLTNPATNQYCLTYTPASNYNGPDTLCILICDGAGGCDTSYVYITVTPVNDPPVVPNTTVSTPEDTPILVCVPITDVDNTSFTVTTLCSPSHGTISGLTNPATNQYCLTYTPNSNYTGPDTLCILICDGAGACDTSYVYISVTPINDPPSVPNVTTSTPEDTPVLICAPITDMDNASFTVTTLCSPSHGTISGLTNPATNQYCLTYTPNLNYNGPDTLCILVCDGAGGCDTSYVYITVTPVNDPPIANDDTATTPEDTPVTFNITANDTDVDGAINLASVDLDLGNPGIQTSFTVAGGTFTYNGAGGVTFTPIANFSGTAVAQYLVCDNGTPLPALCDAANITVTVTPVNDPPIANDDNATTPEDTPVTFNVTNNDTDVDGAINLASLDLDTGTPGVQTTFTVAGQGTFVRDGAGNVTFTPVLNFNGTVTAMYQVCDNGTPLPAQCDQALITVIVTPVNDGPIANDDNATTTEDTPVAIPVLNNDTDVDGTLNPASVVLFDTPNNGVATVNPLTGAITYTPNTDFVGNDTLVYTVCDSGTPVLCDNATVIISVTATSVRLLAQMRLQGALYNSPDTLMRDNLRSLGRIPKSEPYTALPDFVHVGGGGEMVTDSATVFANYGANSIVDWVFIELRNPNNPAQVVATRSALLQRDGDVVDVDGVSPLVFESTLPGFFYVAIRHRNHLGSMTANTIVMTNEGTVIDFRNLATPLWDDNTNLDGLEQVTINGKFALWAGNVNTNKSVVFAGQNNDKDPVFNLIDQAPGNIFHSQSYVYNGYHLGDVNMDGKAIFAGQNNDVDYIFNNVDGHPRNVTHSQSFVIRQQLAE